MKNIFIKTLLISALIAIQAAIGLRLFAEIEFNNAEGLALKGDFLSAEGHYNRTMQMDPFSSRYIGGFADALYRFGVYSKEDTIKYFKKADTLYDRAIKLNPLKAEHYLGRGLLKLAIYRRYRSKEGEGFMADFQNAWMNDPHRADISYAIGSAGIRVWPSLDQHQKEFFLERLKYCLRRQWWHIEIIYARLWKETRDLEILQEITPDTLKGHKALYNFIRRNNLWQYHRKQLEKVNYYRQKEEPEDYRREKDEHTKAIEELKSLAREGRIKGWMGKSFNGKHTYTDGNMYWSGTMQTALNLTEGESVIVIRAKGAMADNIFPFMIVELDGKNIGEAFIDSLESKDYYFPVESEGGISIVSITFANDGLNRSRGEDRNLHVGSISVRKDDE
ncbi:MAG: hypothetical protein HQ572_02425 [Candidatus Omnitrophica bacterium]|nr:hypothetical protein [Candidatus Omnitrophota bacterium]